MFDIKTIVYSSYYLQILFLAYMASCQTTEFSSAYEFYHKSLKSPKYIVAPMVDQSELPFRMLCRQYGAQLCYSPMIHSAIFVKDKIYRAKVLTTDPLDHPLIIQFCANNPETLLQAAQLVEGRCEGVDINLGCPQSIAKKGNYGAFLQDNWHIIGELVSVLHNNLKVPVTCKIRVFSDIKRTVEYALFLQGKGCSLLTVHGRTREQKGVLTGVASWEHILAVKRAVSIPVFANGNVMTFDDVTRCMFTTMADGIMSAEGLLYNPALFSGETPCVSRMAIEYLEMVDRYPVHNSAIRGHLFKILHSLLQDAAFTKFKQRIGTAGDVKCFKEIVTDIVNDLYRIEDREKWVCRAYIHHSVKKTETNNKQENCGIMEGSGDIINELFCCDELNTDNISLKRTEEGDFSNSSSKKAKTSKYTMCTVCGFNPMSSRCEHKSCKQCCKDKSVQLALSCHGHNLQLKQTNL